MKNTHNQTFERYTTYLIANRTQVIIIGLYTILKGCMRHDSITRFLSDTVKQAKSLRTDFLILRNFSYEKIYCFIFFYNSNGAAGILP